MQKWNKNFEYILYNGIKPIHILIEREKSDKKIITIYIGGNQGAEGRHGWCTDEKR